MRIPDAYHPAGCFWFSDTIPGKYVLYEQEAPAGYLQAEPVKFTVIMKEGLQKVAMEDDFIKTSFTKKDAETREALSGAKLQLLDQNKTVIKEWTSGTEPTNFDYIPSGTYYIHEVSAPFGYDISEDKEIHIESKADMQSFEITDDKLYELPFPGKKDIYYIIFVCVGIALIALVNRKKIRV